MTRTIVARLRAWALLGAALLLSVPALAADAAAGAPDSSGETVTLPRTVTRVWLKTPDGKLTGDMLLTEEGIEFDARKRRLFLGWDQVDILTFGRVKGDVDTDWAVLRVVEDGVYRRYAIRDGKRMGYGVRTAELYAELRDVLRDRGAGQFAAADGYEPLVLFDVQFSTEHPAGWELTHRDLIDEGDGRFFGSLVVAPVELDPTSREAPPPGSFLIHRRPAEKSMRCEGIGKDGLASLADLLAELKRPAVASADWQSAPLGGCAGLKASVDGIELRAAADGETLVVLELPAPGSGETNRTPFDHAVETFRFAWGY